MTSILPSDWSRYPSMQELGEALVNLLDLYSIEYVVGLGEGAGANILARCADNTDPSWNIASTCQVRDGTSDKMSGTHSSASHLHSGGTYEAL